MNQMKLYYSAIIYIVIAAMAGLGLQLKSNDVLSKSEKKGFAFTMAILMIVSLAEWTGVIVEGKSTVLIPLHKLVKCIEFSLAPVVPIAFIARLKKRRAAYFSLFGVHAILEILSIPYGFIFDIDANNMYHRADFYWIYILFYVLGMILFLVETVKLNDVYQGQNMASLVGIVFFLITGILFQIFNRQIRTDWLTVAIALILLYAYYCNLVLEVDSLTMILNRACYEKKLEQLRYRTAILTTLGSDPDNRK